MTITGSFIYDEVKFNDVIDKIQALVDGGFLKTCNVSDAVMDTIRFVIKLYHKKVIFYRPKEYDIRLESEERIFLVFLFYNVTNVLFSIMNIFRIFKIDNKLSYEDTDELNEKVADYIKFIRKNELIHNNSVEYDSVLCPNYMESLLDMITELNTVHITDTITFDIFFAVNTIMYVIVREYDYILDESLLNTLHPCNMLNDVIDNIKMGYYYDGMDEILNGYM